MPQIKAPRWSPFLCNANYCNGDMIPPKYSFHIFYKQALEWDYRIVSLGCEHGNELTKIIRPDKPREMNSSKVNNQAKRHGKK